MQSTGSSRKRKNSERDDAFFRCTGLGVADAAVRTIIARLQKEDTKNETTSSYSRCSEVRYAKLKSCLRCETLETEDGTCVDIFTTDLEKYLDILMERNTAFQKCLKDTLGKELQENPQGVSGVVYLDECVPGNILAPDNRRKSYMIYFCYGACAKFRSLHYWWPIGLLRHTEVDKLEGGLPEVFTKVLRSQLEFYTGLILDGTMIPVSKLFFIADEAALKMACGSKGASGMRPCLHCDAFSKEREDMAALVGSYPITAPDFSVFNVIDDSTVHEILQHLQHVKNTESLTSFRTAQTLFGWTLNDQCCFLDPGLSRYLQPSACHYDAMHCYWSNGQVNCEVGLFWTEAVRLAGLQRVQLETFFACPWKKTTSIGGALSPHSLKSLVHNKLLREGQDYRGDAGQCLDILPLLAFFAEHVLASCAELGPHIRSLRALWQVTTHILTAKNNFAAVRGLQNLQSKHLGLFVECYGPDKVRPKHHFASHIEQQTLDSKILLDCFPGERKNGIFKNQLCPKITRLQGFEKSILLRFLEWDLANIESCVGTTTILKQELHEVISDGSKIAKGLVCRWGEIKSGHILLMNHDEALQVVGCIQKNLVSEFHNSVLYMINTFCECDV